MKKIVILGSNGYISRNLAFILKRDYAKNEVLLYDRSPIVDAGNSRFTQVDLTDRKSLRKIDMNCDIIFMMVGKTGSTNGFDEYNEFIDINEKSLLNLLSEYREQNSKAKIIFPSTRLVYKGEIGLLKESDAKELKSIYAINKFACEQYLEQFHRVFNVQYCIFRICLPYGTLVPNASSYGTAEFMINKATNGDNIILYGDGSARRTLTHMEDLCKALIEGAFSENCINNIFNIGGENYSLKEMAELIARKYGVGIDFVPWPKVAFKIESGDTVFDSTKLDSIIEKYTLHSFKEWISNYDIQINGKMRHQELQV